MPSYVTRLRLENFRRFKELNLPLESGFNVVVGNNETGKSTILEAMSLVLSGKSEGRSVYLSLDPYWFHKAVVDEYFKAIREGSESPPPEILIEAYLSGTEPDPELSHYKGTINELGENVAGVSLRICVAEGLAEELRAYAEDEDNPAIVPVEFYQASWRSFAGHNLSSRKLPFKVKAIDATRSRGSRGPSRYVNSVVESVLTDEQRRTLAHEYRRVQHAFSSEDGVQAINDHLRSEDSPITSKRLTVQMDMSTRSSWNQAISAHLDDLPFELSGRGEQVRLETRIALASSSGAGVVLIEEPENHLSHGGLNSLLDDIQRHGDGRQLVITTHSAFVLNKLGLDRLRLLSSNGGTLTLEGLQSDTQGFFKKLPGFDTLRLVLADRCILVEGPSDELIVQRAYRDVNGKLPLADAIDVISVRGLAFKRFLEIAAKLDIHVAVVTDNDGDLEALRAKYEDYLGGNYPNIAIYFDDDEEAPSLEDQLVKENGHEAIRTALGTRHPDAASLIAYMKDDKTECALRLFESFHGWRAPEYIRRAVGR